MPTLMELTQEIAEKPDTFTVNLPGVEPMQFRRITSAGEWYDLQRSAREFWGACKIGNIPPGLVDVKPDNEEVCKQAYMLHQTAVEPPLGLDEALKVAKHAGIVFVRLVSEVDMGNAEALIKSEGDKIERLGESSEETTSTEGISS